MSSEELKQAAARELRDIDSRALFWVDLALATAEKGAADDVGWGELDWDELRAELNEWLDGLDPDSGPDQFQWQVTDTVMLICRARPRAAQSRGWRAKPSLVIADPPMPPLRFADGSSGSLDALSLADVRALATGERRLAIELPSHREVWDMLRGEMEALGYANTADMGQLLLEPTASALGLHEAPPGLGDFDEGWRAINRVEFPITDDPRGE